MMMVMIWPGKSCNRMVSVPLAANLGLAISVNPGFYCQGHDIMIEPDNDDDCHD